MSMVKSILLNFFLFLKINIKHFSHFKIGRNERMENKKSWENKDEVAIVSFFFFIF